MDKVIRINLSDTVNDDQTTVSTEKDNSNNKKNNNDAADDDHTLIIEEDDDDDDDDDDDLKIFCQRRQRRRRRRRRRRVSFDRIYIREHPRIVGDHPAVKYGPALAIDWYNNNNNDDNDNNDHQPASISDSFVSSSVPCSITSSSLSSSLSSQFHCVETSVDDYERIRSSVRKRGSELVLTSIDREKILHEWDIIKTTPSIQRLDDDWSLCHYPSSYHYTTWVPRLVNNDDIDNDNDSHVNGQSYHMKQLSPLFSRKIIESVTACVTHDNEQQHITSPLFCQGMLDDKNGVLLNDDFMLDSTSSTSHQYLSSSIDQVEFNKYYCQDDNDDDDNNVSLQNESGNGIINNNNNNNMNDNQMYNDDANQSFGMFDSMTSTHIKVFILEN